MSLSQFNDGEKRHINQPNRNSPKIDLEPISSRLTEFTNQVLAILQNPSKAKGSVKEFIRNRKLSRDKKNSSMHFLYRTQMILTIKLCHSC
ncbi:MAG: hypothetical protein OHK0017_09000 [Patescibacteria group bacterium]